MRFRLGGRNDNIVNLKNKKTVLAVFYFSNFPRRKPTRQTEGGYSLK